MGSREFRYQSFRQFWPFYLSQHKHPGNRILHVLGSVAALIAAVFLIWQQDLRALIFIPVIGYTFAWVGHFFFEKNRPATFRYPLYSLRGDFKMLWLTLSGSKAKTVTKISIATCSDKRQLTVSDRLLVQALQNQGLQATPFIWDQSTGADNFEAVLVRSVWDYHLQVKKFEIWISQLENAQIPIINDPQALRWNLDKSYLFELMKNQIPCVPTLKLISSDSLEEKLRQIQKTDWNEIVIKPTISASSYLTFRSETASSDLPSLLAQVSEHSDILIQPFLPSIEKDGEISLVFIRGSQTEFSHAVLKNSRPGDFRVQSEFGGSEAIYEDCGELVRLAERALQSVPGDWASARVDIVDWKIEPLVSEIELIEPDLFLSLHPPAAEKLARAICLKLGLASGPEIPHIKNI